MDSEKKLQENITCFKCLKRMTGTVQANIKKDYDSKKPLGLFAKIKKNILLEFVDRLYKSAVELQRIELEKMQSIDTIDSRIHKKYDKYKKVKPGEYSTRR